MAESIRVGAPELPAAACELLQALVLGLDLRADNGLYAFVGPLQRASNSCVDPEVIARLLADDFIRLGIESSVEITPAGRNALHVKTIAVVQDALEWVNSSESNTRIY